MVEIKDPKSKKYDRQIRIWGAHGQAALESAKICLLNCGPTGSETLKNLVLGIDKLLQPFRKHSEVDCPLEPLYCARWHCRLHHRRRLQG